MQRPSGMRTALAATACALLAFSCASSGAATSNEADRTFVAQMIPHHHLGMRLLDEATVNSNDVRLRRAVFEMHAYHASEMTQLEWWASSWDTSPAATFPGDLPESDMDRLSTTSGTAHDILWLVLMIRHHRGALDITANDRVDAMAATRDMATTIHDVQLQQIGTMQELLDELCSESPIVEGCDRSR